MRILLGASRVWLVAFVGLMFATAAVKADVGPEQKSRQPEKVQVKSLRITVLSTMLTGGKGIGEWGFAALVEADGKRLLFDTGNRPDTVLNNAKELGIDLGGITDVVISHHHQDHIGGLLKLRRAYRDEFPDAFTRVIISEGAFISRGPADKGSGDENPLIALRPVLKKEGVVFHETAKPVEIWPGVWFTGPVPRKYPDEQLVPPGWVRRGDDGSLIPDTTPDDAALVVNTDKGLVVLTGCGHAGLVNTLVYAQQIVRPAPIYAATGGFHIFKTSDSGLDWTIERLRELGLAHLHGGHCTGIEAVYRIRTQLGLSREAASVAAVGAWFDLESGIHPLDIAR